MNIVHVRTIIERDKYMNLKSMEQRQVEARQFLEKRREGAGK